VAKHYRCRATNEFFFKLDNNQDDGDAGDDDVSSNDNTDILSSL
jgi:hypothetical protein